MLALKLDAPLEASIQAHGDDLFLSVTQNGKFFTLVSSSFDVKIHEFTVLLGTGTSAHSHLCKEVAKITGCKRMFLLAGCDDLTLDHVNNILGQVRAAFSLE